MKVTYTQNRFEIDGVEIINPEVLGLEKYRYDVGHYYNPMNIDMHENKILLDGDSFDLPENIIAEKEDVGQCKALYDDSEHCTCKDNCAEFVYRLKLKEPLVDTGSKEPLEYNLYQPVEGGINGTHISAKYNVEPLQTKKRRIMDCAQWLSFCLEIGYPKSSLDALEKLWHEHHP